MTYQYDAAGNITSDGSGFGAHTYTYDAENRLTATAGINYTYDGDGRVAQALRPRAEGAPCFALARSGAQGSKAWGLSFCSNRARIDRSAHDGKLYWYGAGTDPITETDAAGNNPVEYVFFGGKRIAKRDSSGTISYYFADHLGTSRVVTNATGTVPVLDDSDFYPFGGERPVVGPTSGNNYKFTGKERDAEDGLDDLEARYYSSALGRFITPDWSAEPVPVPYADLSNPQTLNLYGYVKNSPTTLTDPNGHMLLGWGCYISRTCLAPGVQYAQSPSPIPSPTPPPVPPLLPAAGAWEAAGTAAAEEVAKATTGISAAVGGLIIVDLALAAYDAVKVYQLYQSYKLSKDKPGVEPTPKTHADIYEPVGGTPAKRNKITGEVWEIDQKHRNHYEVYKNLNEYRKRNGKRDRAVWDDGRLKEKF